MHTYFPFSGYFQIITDLLIRITSRRTHGNIEGIKIMDVDFYAWDTKLSLIILT